VQSTGSLFALDESIVSAQVEGQIRRIWVDIGDTVKEGQQLVTIDPTELQLHVDTQRAAVRQVRAQLGIGPNDGPPSDPSMVSLVQRAAADLMDAREKFERAQQLFQSNLISREQFDEVAAKFDNARAAHKLALEQVEQLAAQLQSSEARQRLAEKKLADAVIRAPFSGAVKERRVNPGEFIAAQTPVMVLVRTDELRSRLDVPEKWASAVRLGSTVEVHVDAYPGDVFEGKVVHINPTVNPTSRTFQIEALLTNKDARLKPGFFVQASLRSEVEEKTISVPAEALVYVFGTYKVYVLDGKRVVEREVKTGLQNSTPSGVRVDITEGLKVGEQVALAPPGTLFNGAIVSVQAR
jgi:RND family efflux transporter MFP subunit